jgi:SAM-dependent methyltransferase
MYDSFSTEYDRFVNWPSRLAFEMPFLERQLQTLAAQVAGPLRILDVACGTGWHVIALSQKGYRAAGADYSAGMVDRARANAVNAGVQVRFERSGFGELTRTFGSGSFDALFCLGNSLPHVTTSQGLTSALKDFSVCLRAGGLLLVQNRNFDSVMASLERWMEPQAHREGETEWVFLRFYDFEPNGLVRFNILTLKRTQGEDWKQQVTSTYLRPQLKDNLIQALSEAGFGELSAYGSMTGAPFVPQTSGNLILVAKRV